MDAHLMKILGYVMLGSMVAMVICRLLMPYLGGFSVEW